MLSIDPKGGWVYYLASPDDRAGRFLYRSPLTGSATAERLTPAGPSAVHSYNISPNAEWAIHTVSRLDSPPTVSMISLPDHAVHKVLIDNNDVRDKLAETPRGELEFFVVKSAGGTEFDGWMMKPPSFDPTRQYPVLMYAYGEPAGQTVLNRWGRNGSRFLWHLMLTQKGYIVASIDNRGTPAPKGREWRKSAHKQIGALASADQAAAVEALLAERSYLDPNRVGAWGWSGGGQTTLNSLFRYPDVYKTGIAVAFVADQRLYDTIYQERYMGLPDKDADAYAQGSPITHAANLEGDLLLIHGTGDDNVHYQHAEQLIDRLIEHDKDFSIMIYPDRSHSISEKENTQRHLFRTMTNFLLDTLPPNPQSDE